MTDYFWIIIVVFLGDNIFMNWIALYAIQIYSSLLYFVFSYTLVKLEYIHAPKSQPKWHMKVLFRW